MLVVSVVMRKRVYVTSRLVCCGATKKSEAVPRCGPVPAGGANPERGAGVQASHPSGVQTASLPLASLIQAK
jgi:hypothetical protein